MATVLANIQCPTVSINSVEKHVYLLFRLGRTVAVSKAVEEFKKLSSKWLIIFGIKRSIIGQKRSRRNAASFWRNITLNMMRGMFGIDGQLHDKELGRPFRA